MEVFVIIIIIIIIIIYLLFEMCSLKVEDKRTSVSYMQNTFKMCVRTVISVGFWIQSKIAAVLSRVEVSSIIW